MASYGLIIKQPHLDNIFSGKKTWEIRGSATKRRGKIALIESGSGEIKGYAEIIDSVGPLSKSDLIKNKRKHLVSEDVIKKGLRYKKPHAWILKSAKRLARPKKYDHPQGAVIWVKL
jgi:hypothetical protein